MGNFCGGGSLFFDGPGGDVIQSFLSETDTQTGPRTQHRLEGGGLVLPFASPAARGQELYGEGRL